MAETEEPKPGKSPEDTHQEQIPIRDLMNIQEAMNELFSDLFSGRPVRALPTQDSWQPPVDIYENKEAIFILMDIPGMTPRDIDITATPENIIVKGERKASKEVGDENYILREHYYGTFSRSIPLPYPVKPRDIKATYKDGTLELRLPKTKSGKGKSVRIDVE